MRKALACKKRPLFAPVGREARVWNCFTFRLGMVVDGEVDEEVDKEVDNEVDEEVDEEADREEEEKVDEDEAMTRQARVWNGVRSVM